MDTKHSKYLIVGAGLSGLVTAYALIQDGEDDFVVLEGRPEVGGRIRTEKGIDLGATWFQQHHEHLSQLMEVLNLDRFEQYSRGKSVLVYNTMAPAHYFENDASGPAANRISGGSIALINRLTSIVGDRIRLNQNAKAIADKGDRLELKTEKGLFSAEKVILTLPPKLATTLDFSPTLPDELLQSMQQTHTWMSNAIKVGIVFKDAFWRKKGFSGTMVGQVGPVIELYDHSSHDEQTHALMGFVNEGLRDTSPEDRKSRILGYLEKYLGPEVRNPIDYFEKDWSEDAFTSSQQLKSVYMSPEYGNMAFDRAYMDGKLLFSGTETSPVYGGYLEGAVYSGLKTAQVLLGNQS